jgi:alanyl-tRNA synthetase
VRRLHEAEQEHERERRRLMSQLDAHTAEALVGSAREGVVVARCDGRDQQAMRELVERLRHRRDITAVGLVGTPDGESVVVGVGVTDGMTDAQTLARSAAKAVGGGAGGRDRQLAVGGGRDVARIEDALELLRAALAPAGVSDAAPRTSPA